MKYSSIQAKTEHEKKIKRKENADEIEEKNKKKKRNNILSVGIRARIPTRRYYADYEDWLLLRNVRRDV